jgi:hypothetical protein
MEFQVAFQWKCHLLKLLIAQFGANFFYFTKNDLHLKKIDNVEAKK